MDFNPSPSSTLTQIPSLSLNYPGGAHHRIKRITKIVHSMFDSFLTPPKTFAEVYVYVKKAEWPTEKGKPHLKGGDEKPWRFESG
jgi:hypothetical protein